MFDNKIIVPESLKRTDDGFALQARLPYYRGLGLSMVEDIAITIDGEKIPRENVRFSVRGNTWTLDEMETEYGDRWNFGEIAMVTAETPDGLAEGDHEVEVCIRTRISYMPFKPTTTDRKVLTIQAS